MRSSNNKNKMTSVEKSEKGSDKNLAADKNQKPLFQDGNK
jgi:hypothetical protein